MTAHDPALVERVAEALTRAGGSHSRFGSRRLAEIVLDAITTSPRHALVELPEPGYHFGAWHFHEGALLEPAAESGSTTPETKEWSEMTAHPRWPLRYRAAHRAHAWVNRVHNATGRHRITWWLNCKVGSLWIGWFIERNTSHDH